MTTVITIEDTLLDVITDLNCWTMVQSAGRKVLPETIYYPACFVFFDGDDAVATHPRPVDSIDFKIVIQVQNMAGENLAANDAYTLNDLVRSKIRGKTLGIPDIKPFTCVSRRCTDYDDSEGMIEYTHIYRTQLYQPVVTE